MIVYPTIELQQGRPVSLIRGHMDTPHLWHVDPVERACAFAEDGAEWLHVTDLDAVSGSGTNAELIRQIIRKAGAPVQVSGGVRTLEHIQGWLDAGAGRVVIGTAAVREPDLVRRAARLHPDQIALAVDAAGGRVMVEGWTETTAFDPIDFVRAFNDEPLAAVIFTDIDRDLDHPDASVALTSQIAREATAPVISSGLVKTLDDLSALKFTYNVAGAIVGRALFSRTFSLSEALDLARPEPGRVPEMI